MPGLRYQLGMSPSTNFMERCNVNAPASRNMGGISRDLEMLQPQNRPHVSAHCSKALRRAQPQWLQQGSDGRRLSFNETKHLSNPSLLSDTSYENDDLQAMVHDFIENDCVQYMDGVDGDVASHGLTISENLQILTKPRNSEERELRADVQRLLMMANEDTDLLCDPNSTNYKTDRTKRFIARQLMSSGYSASVCKSKWVNSGHVPGGEYEYIDIVVKGDQGMERLLVDINFQAQFEIARPTPHYEAALRSLPIVFVGNIAILEQVLGLMSEAAKASLEQNDMHLPPWRTLDYLKAKWLSELERKLDGSGVRSDQRGSSSLQRRDNRVGIHSEARHCRDDFRHAKISLLAETSASGPFDLQRARNPPANLLLRAAA
ncbi:uncharacterized protein [Physcomitrium patens]|uniref:Uncharacterized protein n=1 Tax=Physcomitrium patens TaxID=3218 RepID=A0A2K1IHC1_PHYPA|nr:uncharacterized protein LOC112276944 [Physcomitrium patens]PNR28672.1 hypothetical protein PHYPA_029265 [Physcomitrium patens]|eukprot:XP_024364541.1 uncharacterized protein LOC112276944 [Physcomitrella patens]